MRESRPALQQELFYRYWVLKESFAKATREGLALGMDTFEIALGSPSVLVRQPEKYPESYHYREGALYGGRLVLPNIGTGGPEGEECRENAGSGMYRIAVCSTDSLIEEIIQTDITDL